MRLTLRTLLAYLDDTLPAGEARTIGEKVAESEDAKKLMERLKVVVRKRSLATPTTGEPGSPSDPNTVADYLSDTLPSNQVASFEQACLDSEVNLAEVAACHQVLTLLLSEPVRVPPTARKRMYGLVTGPESLPNRKPGGTLPIGGVAPITVAAEPTGADATLLMGLPPVSEAGKRKLVPVFVGAGLAAATILTAYVAIPKSKPLASIPSSPLTGMVKPTETETPNTKPVTKPTNEVTKPVPEEPTKTPEPNPIVKPVETPAVIAAPVNDRVTIGKLQNPEAVVLERKPGGEEEKWVRVTAEEPGVHTGDTIIALPGYKAKVLLDAEFQLELWGNLPEQVPSPLRESAVRIHVPTQGITTDVTVLTGRVYLSAKRPTGAKARIRYGNETWDIALPDDKSLVAFEVTHTPPKGFSGERTPAVASAAISLVRGAATVTLRGQAPIALTTGNELLADTTGKLIGPRKLEGHHPADYYSPAQAFTGDVAPIAQKALLLFSKTFADKAQAKAAFAVAMAAEPAGPDAAAMAYTAHTAVYWEAAVGELNALCDALTDATRRTFRVAAIDSLSATLARNPEVEPKLKEILTTRGRLNEPQSNAVIALLHGPKPAERNEPEIREKMLAWLASDSLPVRELAHWVLVNEIDPDAMKVTALARFDPAAPADAREVLVKAWRMRFAEMK